MKRKVRALVRHVYADPKAGGLGLDVGQKRPPGPSAAVRLQHSDELDVGELRPQPP